MGRERIEITRKNFQVDFFFVKIINIQASANMANLLKFLETGITCI